MSGDGIEASPVSMIFADLVHRSPSDGKFYIMGVFSDIYTLSFPAILLSIGIFQRFTDAYGENVKEGCLEMQYLDGFFEKVAQFYIPITFNKDRLSYTDLAFNFSGPSFPRAGKVEVTFSLDGKVVNRGVININKKEKTQ